MISTKTMSKIMPASHEQYNLVNSSSEASMMKSLNSSLRKSTNKPLKRKQSKCLVNISDSRRVKWDLFVMFLAIYNCFSIPFFLSFDVNLGTTMLVIDSTIDLVFVLDIILNFRTTFISLKTGEEITDTKKIASNYIRGKFFIDLLASIPFDTITMLFDASSQLLQLFSLLKLIRILRLSKIILYMRTQEDVKLTMRLLQFMLFLLMYLHVVACTWYVLVNIRKEWNQEEFYTEDTVYQYAFSLYFSSALLVGIEVNPQTTEEVIYCAVILLTGSLITAVLFGQMAVIMADINRHSTRFNEIMNDVNTAMKNLKLPQQLQLQISDFLVSTQSKLTEMEEFIVFKNGIPPSLHAEVNRELFNKLKHQTMLFPDAFILEVVNRSENFHYKPEEVVIKQHKKSDGVFFLLVGRLGVNVESLNGICEPKRHIYPGNFFGEIGVLFNTRRTANVNAIDHSSTAKVKSEDFERMLEMFPGLREDLVQRVHTGYNDKFIGGLEKMLGKIAFFCATSELQYIHLKHSMLLEVYKPGDVIFHTGEICNKIMFLVEGSVDFIFSLKEVDCHICQFHGKSILCGFLALIKSPCPVKIVATSIAKIWVLPTSEIERISINIDGNLKGRLDVMRSRYSNGKDEDLDYSVPIIDAHQKTTNHLDRKALKTKLKLKHAVLKIIMRIRQKLKHKRFDIYVIVRSCILLVRSQAFSWPRLRKKVWAFKFPAEYMQIAHLLAYGEGTLLSRQMGDYAQSSQKFLWKLERLLLKHRISSKKKLKVPKTKVEDLEEINNMLLKL